jgi:hypothetical protein
LKDDILEKLFRSFDTKAGIRRIVRRKNKRRWDKRMNKYREMEEDGMKARKQSGNK